MNMSLVEPFRGSRYLFLLIHFRRKGLDIEACFYRSLSEIKASPEDLSATYCQKPTVSDHC